MKSISSFNCCKNMFTLINIWMIGKKHYLKKKKKIFTVTLTWKTLGVYHDLYLPRDTLLLADVFENF